MNPADCLSRATVDVVDYKCLHSPMVSMAQGTVDPSKIPVALTAIRDPTPLLSHLRTQCSTTEIADVLERIRRAQERDDEVKFIRSAVDRNVNHYKDIYAIMDTVNGQLLVKKHPMIAEHYLGSLAA